MRYPLLNYPDILERKEQNNDNIFSIRTLVPSYRFDFTIFQIGIKVTFGGVAQRQRQAT